MYIIQKVCIYLIQQTDRNFKNHIMNKYAATPCNIKMKLMSKDVNIEKVCKNMWEVYTFERDMPAKHKLLFSKKPYIIATYYLDAINN